MSTKALIFSLLMHAAIVGAIYVAYKPIVVSEEAIEIEMRMEMREEMEAENSSASESEIENVENVEEVEKFEEVEKVEKVEKISEEDRLTEEVGSDVREGEECEEKPKVVSEAEALNEILPKYPRLARQKRHEGSVTVEFEILASGEVGEASVVVSSGHRELDRAALEAVRKARFVPASLDGVSISSTLRLTFDFRLR